MSLSIVLDELLSITLEQATVAEVKSKLFTLDILLQTEAIPEAGRRRQLLTRAIFPVRYLDRQVRLLSTETEFAIVDR